MEKLRLVTFGLVLASLTAIVSGCGEDIPQSKHKVPEVNAFLENVEQNPVLIDGTRLGAIWRVVRVQASYFDGDVLKEWDENYLDQNEFANYKEYWTFSEDKVLMTFAGDRYGKNWDDYFEIFDQRIDYNARTLTVDYVYDGGDKQYTTAWHVNSLTDQELVLTDENAEESYFYQYTFRRE